MQAKYDFFISYNKADIQWAEWIAWQLEKAKFTTILQAWDFRPGSNFVLDMQKAAENARRTVMVLSPSYLKSFYTHPEWAAAFARDPTGEKGLLVPVRVRECELKGVLAQIVYVDLVGLDEEAARDGLLKGIEIGRVKPVSAPGFPGFGTHPAGEQPQFPGTLPPITADLQRSKWTRTKQQSLATWIFGSLLFAFLLGVFIFSPEMLPEFKHRLLAILSALLAALFGYFLTGEINLEISKESPFGQLAVKAAGGVALFALVLWWWSSPLAPVQKQIELPKEPYEQVLAGSVYNQSGDPIEDVKVSIPKYGKTVSTNSLGRFEMKVEADHQLTVELMAQKDGFKTHEQYATLGNNSISFTLKETK